MRWLMAQVKTLRAGWRTIAADTLSSVTFFTVVVMALEVFVAGMTVSQSAVTRLTAAPINAVTGRPYGKFRDWMFSKTCTHSAGWVKRTMVDTTSFVLFQMTLYAGILKFSGATLQQIAVACAASTTLSLFIGRPYGLWQDFVRRIFGITIQS